ncbi:MAG: MBL fold metallo-hydrolase [Gemmatimonadaceae bacterium]|nr:MBL fold metallo-hydrolase [Gemmatimonadaceae bacterium]
MLLKRFYHEGLAQASYLVGCQKTGEALVIDANRDADQYIAAATAEGVRITHVTETHIHADYLSGSRELAARTGATLLLSAEGGRDWQYAFATRDGAQLLRDGDAFSVGNLRLDVMHTPGHTPEHLIFILTDTPAAAQPVGAFTGDFIFAGDVGRPDLLERAAKVEGTMRAGAAQLFQSLQRFVTRYPDYLQLWPGHGSGSACGKALGAVPQTTLGYEKLANWALQIDDEPTFIEAVLEGQPDPPRYFATMKHLNREGPAILGHRPAPAHASAAHLDDALAGSALVVDIRRADVAANRFIPGTLNIPLNKSFTGWAGWLVGHDRDVFLLDDASDDRAARDAAAELAMIGLDRVAGWFGSEAFTAWSASGRRFDSVEQVDPSTLAEWAGEATVTVVDVRATSEWEDGHLPGALHAPLGRLSDALPRLAGADRLVMQCQGGGRSAIAASLARLHGVSAVANLRGGFAAWRSAGLPVERGSSGAIAGTR